MLGILAGIAVPVYSSFVDDAKFSEAYTGLEVIAQAEKMYFAEYGAYVTCCMNDGVQFLARYTGMTNPGGVDSAFMYQLKGGRGSNGFVVRAILKGSSPKECIEMNQKGEFVRGFQFADPKCIIST